MDTPSGSAEFVNADELKRLRRRAYGPDADIAGDAAAQARLAELEAAERRRVTAVDAAAEVPAPVRERVRVTEPGDGQRLATTLSPQPVDGAFAENEPAGGSVTEHDTAETPITNGTQAEPWWRRRRWLLVLVGAIAVVALITGYAAGMSRLLAPGSTPIPTESSTAKNESSEPKPVLQLTPQGPPAQGSIPVDDEAAVVWDVTVDDFVSYGSFGPLEIWSTTKPEGLRCIAVVGENHISVFRCTAPSVDTIADFNIDPNVVPRAPSGEPNENIRFVLHDEVVDVYLPNSAGGFY
jgi:hypothetical protein